MTRRVDNLASRHDTTADLFGGLQVRMADAVVPAASVEVGWAAWRAALPPGAGRWQRLRFWLARWHQVSLARYFVQVDGEYRVASSVSLRHRPDGSGLEARLLQAATPWQLLWLRLRSDRVGIITLTGRQARVARMPGAPAFLPPLPISGAGCVEVLIDGEQGGTLPLSVNDR